MDIMQDANELSEYMKEFVDDWRGLEWTHWEQETLDRMLIEITAQSEAVEILREENKQLQAENEELRQAHNEQSICAEEFARTRAENVRLREGLDGISDLTNWEKVCDEDYNSHLVWVGREGDPDSLVDTILNSTSQTSKVQAVLDTAVELECHISNHKRLSDDFMEIMRASQTLRSKLDAVCEAVRAMEE